MRPSPIRRRPHRHSFWKSGHGARIRRGPRSAAAAIRSGGFSVKAAASAVYAAYDTALRREVALATVKTEGLDEAGLVRVRREAQSMALLGDHPHIVTIHDIGDDEGRPFIVSQFMSGGSVEDLLDRADDHRLSISDAIRIAGELAAALEHAHTRGVIHRDLKPANVWLSEDGEARLGDFGLAVVADHSRITSEGMMVGTVAYMAPEQALGGEVGTTADLYSLGALLYELLTGRPPFVGGDAVSIISQHLNTQPMAPSWHNPAVPRSLGGLVLELLAKNADERPTSAAIVRRRLEEIAAHPSEPTLEISAVAPLPASQRLARIGRRGRFVGRTEELGVLKTAVEAALEGRGGIALVSGEPGIGKSRLVEEAGVYARLRGAQVLTGRCYETEPVRLLLPFAEAIRAYVVQEPPDDLKMELGEGASDVASLVSEIRQRLPDLPESTRTAGDDARYQLVRERLDLPLQRRHRPSDRPGARGPPLGRRAVAATAVPAGPTSRRQPVAGDRDLAGDRGDPGAPIHRGARESCAGSGASSSSLLGGLSVPEVHELLERPGRTEARRVRGGAVRGDVAGDGGQPVLPGGGRCAISWRRAVPAGRRASGRSTPPRSTGSRSPRESARWSAADSPACRRRPGRSWPGRRSSVPSSTSPCSAAWASSTTTRCCRPSRKRSTPG